MDLNPVTLITPSDIMEYVFCPRFIYYIYAAGVPQQEQRRYKVQKGREIHEIKQSSNISYLWKKIGCKKRESSVYLSSVRLNLKGIIDEVLTLDDDTMAPMDFKFSEFQDEVYKTHRIQSVCYGLLIEENYDLPVEKGYVLYTRSNTFKEIKLEEKDKKNLRKIISEMLRIIEEGYFPCGTGYTARCTDCTYKNICCG
ncbi:MAG: CRISPR-associated protein Cas4 [Firmicutes bacterium]|nr:CRISPR-associated protein Cas4 [Bacillota bacterium]